MAGLWDTGTKKQQSSSMWGGEGGKSVYETYGGKEESAPRASMEDLTDEEKKLIKDYNNPKNEAAFKKSREIFNQILNDPNNKDNALAQKLSPFIASDQKNVTYQDNGFVRGLQKASDFAGASNDRFLGGILGGVSDATTWATGKVTGANDQAIKQSQQEVKSRFGISDAQIAQKDELNKDNSAYQAGKVAGDAQRIATDIATTVIPGAAAEKVIRGLSFAEKMANGGRLAKTALDVTANVGSGAVSTAVGIAKDPSQLTAANVGANTAIDAGLGVAGGVFGTIAGKVRQVRNAGELTKALSEVDKASLPKQYADQLSKLQGSQLSGKQFQAEVGKIMDEARSAKKFEVLSDGATANNAHIKTRIEDINRRLSEVDTPEYQANNGLMNTEAAAQKYDEMMADVTKIPGVPEASKAVQEADQQIQYYNDIRMQNPFAKKVDEIRANMAKIEETRQADVGRLETMKNDTASGFDPNAVDSFVNDTHSQYDEMLKAEQAKIDKLMADNPDKAAELQMLDQAEQTVTSQKMDAQKALDDVMNNQMKAAHEEADKIAKTPNEQAIQEHKQFLEQKQQRLTQRFEEAQKRYDNPNTSLKDVNEELMYMQDGTHPLIADGASKQKQFNHYLDLNVQKATMEAKELATSNPEIPKSVGEQAQILDDALQEVATAKVGLGARIGRIWSQPANQLRAAGFEKLADQRTDAIINYNRQGFDIKNTIKDWGKLAKGNSSKDLFRAANGDQAAYEKITPGARQVIDEWRKAAYQMGKDMGLPEEVLAKGDYIPHLFTDVKRNPRLLDLQKKLVEAQKVAVDGMDEKALAKNAKRIEAIQNDIKAITDNPGIVTAQDFIQETGEYSNRFLKERYGAEGYQEDFWKAADAYMNAHNTKVNLEPVMEIFAKAKNLTPEKGMQKFLQTEIDKMRGTKADVDRSLDDWFNSLTNSVGSDRTGNLGTKSLRGFRSAMSLSHIGFSATSAINTLSQVAIMPGTINIDGSLYGMTKAMELSGKLAKNTLTRQETDEFKYMARMGVFEGSSHILPEETMSKYANKFNKAAYAGITGADRYLRMATYYGAKLKADRQGLTGIDAERFIYEKVNEVNQNFSKLEAPHAFRSQVAKTMGSMITFVPGMVVRSAEIGAKSLKGAADIIGHTAKGEPITRAAFMKDVDDISKGVFTMAAVWGTGQAIGAITGQSEIIPNPLNGQTYSSPALQFIFGSDYKTGVMGALTSQSGDKYDENGNNLTRAERQQQLLTEVLPSFLIPGYSQGKRSLEGMQVNAEGVSKTDKGGIRYQADPQYNLQRAVFGQYSTPDGKQYIQNMNKPGGGALSESESQKVQNAPVNLQQQYYDFFRATDKITGRTDANKEVTSLFQDGRPEAARRKAEEYNAKVDSKLQEFFSRYPDLDPELQQDLTSNVYITLTNRSEKSRSKTNDQ